MRSLQLGLRGVLLTSALDLAKRVPFKGRKGKHGRALAAGCVCAAWRASDKPGASEAAVADAAGHSAANVAAAVKAIHVKFRPIQREEKSFSSYLFH